ncbi:MAG: hypothetical protein GXO09_00540 [Crenarchaeota archaeon]|nr:hypothetical protein [Thermoproteota archaeon]
MRIAFISLSSCNGCQVSFLTLVPWLQENGVEIVAEPFIDGRWSGERVDLAIVEGSVFNEEHVRILKEVRRNADKILALGTCAVYGGIQGILRLTLSGGEAATDPDAPRPVTPRPVSEVIDVDALLPRCPPPHRMLAGVIAGLLGIGGEPERLTGLSVCSQCRRKMKPIKELRFRVDFDPAEVDPDTCFLSQGIICLGPVTVGGCGAHCTGRIPCAGCAGPALDLVLMRGLRPVDKLAHVVSALSGRSYEEALEALEQALHGYLAHTFTSSSSLMLSKPRARIIEYVRR